jgi:hypothetical protein
VPACLPAEPHAARAAARRWTDLAEQLCGLEGRRLAAVLGLADEALSDAVELAKRIPRRNQGRRRQVNLVGKLLREQPDAESARLEARAQPARPHRSAVLRWLRCSTCAMRVRAEGGALPSRAAHAVLHRGLPVSNSKPGQCGYHGQGAGVAGLCSWVGSAACTRGKQRLQALPSQPQEPDGGARRRLWRARCWAAARATATAPSASPPPGTAAWSPTTRRGARRNERDMHKQSTALLVKRSGVPVVYGEPCDQAWRTVPGMGSSCAAWLGQEIEGSRCPTSALHLWRHGPDACVAAERRQRSGRCLSCRRSGAPTSRSCGGW